MVNYSTEYKFTNANPNLSVCNYTLSKDFADKYKLTSVNYHLHSLTIVKSY